ncbi:putative piggyBac transposase Uribo1 [Danaus plexippus plexippus]|uniref:PiggyBac transposase Uribo1 n=1 Tax=Danaus plexippus plexippus TaxID=278856 RepID=A0A212F510_DANPL|nr:putative piggyBac transposase Uribo1 [Danaus plexippus plexippus]
MLTTTDDPLEYRFRKPITARYLLYRATFPKNLSVSDDEVENIQLPSPRGFDQVFERALENISTEFPPSSPSREDELECPKNQRLPEPNRKWKKRDLDTIIPEYVLDTGVVEDDFAHCSTPTDIFLVLIEDIIDIDIVYQNLYAIQRDKVLNLKKEELLTFIGMNFFMGYNTRPAWRDHYSSAPDLNNALICKTMPRDRFAIILSHLHCNDNSQMPKDCKDKLYKIRPMIDALNKKFQEEKTKTELKTDYGLGEKVVLELTEQDWGKGKIVYFDNFFSSVALLEKLKTENTYASGTIRSNRKGLAGNMLADSKIKRGDSDDRFSNLDIGYWKWKDNKVVHLVSNFHENETAIVSRKVKNGSKSATTCPIVVKDYNSYMGGVDTADRLRAIYCIDRKSPKWWHRLFWGLLDVTFVNSFVIRGLIMKQTTVKDFRSSVPQGLMTMKDASQKRKTSTDSTAKAGPSKRRL